MQRRYTIIFSLFLIILTISIFLPKETYAWLQTYEIPYNDYGFFSGIWHGLIAPFAVVAQIFDNDIILYSSVNSGFGYNLGFLIGIGCIVGGGARSVNNN